MKTSRVFSRLIQAVPHYRTMILQGGTSSTKTYTTLQLFYIMATQLKERNIFSVVSESVPHLRRGALRDWMNIIGEDYDPDTHNKTEETFNIGKSVVEFFAIDHPDKARGGRRDYLYVNECNRISKDTRDQLEVRTNKKEFLDFNPSSRFWAHDLQGGEGVWFDVSTYRDAIDGEGQWLINEETVRSIESRRNNTNWWRVYGEGQIGQLEGLIIPEFTLIDKMPDIPTDIGLDFGFANDACACVETGIIGDTIYINELFWALGMTNQDIVKKLTDLKVPRDYRIYADSAEPKSIEEIYRAGYFMCKPCQKGKDGFNLGIDFIRRYKIAITKKSVNVIKEIRNATWEQDKTGVWTNKAAHGFLNSIDAIRYSIGDKIFPARSAIGGNF